MIASKSNTKTCIDCFHYSVCANPCTKYYYRVPCNKFVDSSDVKIQSTGHWEEIRNAYGQLEGWLCKCGREVKIKENYCPDCGANMHEE